MIWYNKKNTYNMNNKIYNIILHNKWDNWYMIWYNIIQII